MIVCVTRLVTFMRESDEAWVHQLARGGGYLTTNKKNNLNFLFRATRALGATGTSSATYPKRTIVFPAATGGIAQLQTGNTVDLILSCDPDGEQRMSKFRSGDGTQSAQSPTRSTIERWGGSHVFEHQFGGSGLHRRDQATPIHGDHLGERRSRWLRNR